MNPEPMNATQPPMLRETRILYLVACGLVVMAGISLFIFSERTDTLFAWTIAPAMTAAFMGASYFSAAYLQFMSARRGTWSRAYVGFPGMFIFTVITLIVTLVHIDRFHTDSAIGWIWIGIYALFPVAAAIVFERQLRASNFQFRPDSPTRYRLSHAIRILLIVQGIAFILAGAALLLDLGTFASRWPWELSALTGRAIGAWLVGFSTTAFVIAWDGRQDATAPAGVSSIILVSLIAIGLIRFAGDLTWNATETWLFLVFLGSLIVSGLGIAGVAPFREIGDSFSDMPAKQTQNG